jgi:hypothetical protein
MTKIIRFDPSWRQRERAETVPACDHKNVIAFTASRTVQCAACGTELDPFYVMLELLKGSNPPGDTHRELKLYNRELERREQEKSPKLK